jgi:hypothetical protein
MGLRDVLIGIQNGPRGAPKPTSGGSSGGMSPIVIALLGLLAYKAFKGRGGQTPAAPGQEAPVPRGGTTTAAAPGGGLGDILGGLFGGRSDQGPTRLSASARSFGAICRLGPGRTQDSAASLCPLGKDALIAGRS